MFERKFSLYLLCCVKEYFGMHSDKTLMEITNHCYQNKTYIPFRIVIYQCAIHNGFLPTTKIYDKYHAQISCSNFQYFKGI